MKKINTICKNLHKRCVIADSVFYATVCDAEVYFLSVVVYFNVEPNKINLYYVYEVKNEKIGMDLGACRICVNIAWGHCSALSI